MESTARLESSMTAPICYAPEAHSRPTSTRTPPTSCPSSPPRPPASTTPPAPAATVAATAGQVVAAHTAAAGRVVRTARGLRTAYPRRRAAAARTRSRIARGPALPSAASTQQGPACRCMACPAASPTGLRTASTWWRVCRALDARQSVLGSHLHFHHAPLAGAADTNLKARVHLLGRDVVVVDDDDQGPAFAGSGPEDGCVLQDPPGVLQRAHIPHGVRRTDQGLSWQGQYTTMSVIHSILVFLVLNWARLVQLHNSFIVSLLDPSAHLAPPTPPPDAPKPPPRKRRRTLPYQGEDDTDAVTLRSDRLKRWTIGMGKRERDRLRSLDAVALSTERQPRKERDEIAADRGVVVLHERGGMSVAHTPRRTLYSRTPRTTR